MFIRTAFNYDRRAASAAAALRCLDKSLAQQSQRDDSDVNVIVARFLKTGQLPENQRAMPSYGDFEGVFDFQTAKNIVIAAERAFDEMPAKLRARFSNDPQVFMEFMEDPANQDEMVKLGLAVKRKADIVPPGDQPAGDPPK